MRYFLIVVVFMAMVFVSSCKNDEEPAFRRDLLIDKAWIMSDLDVRILYSGFSVPAADYEDVDECSRDNHFLFLDNGVLNIDENEIICPGSEGGIVASGNWEVQSSTMTITSEFLEYLLDDINQSVPIMLENDSFDFEVRQLTANLLRLFYREQYSDPSNPLMTYIVEVNLSFVAD